MDCGLALLAVVALFGSSLWLTVSVGRLLRENGELYDDFGAIRPAVRERVVRERWLLLAKLSVIIVVGYGAYRYALLGL